jgi:hypothetical protein
MGRYPDGSQGAQPQAAELNLQVWESPS